MPKLYYLFSKTSKDIFGEAIYQCDDGDSIENATWQTGVYPMGAFLSKAIKILTSLEKENFSLISWDEIISNELERFSEKDSSFSNLVHDDDYARLIFKLLFKNVQDFHSKRYGKDFINIFQLYLKYIKLCTNNGGENFSSKEKLYLFLNQTKDSLPEHSTYVTNIPSEQNISSENEIENILSNVNFTNSYFAPPLKKSRQKLLFSLPTSMTPKIRKTKWGKLKLPLKIFVITDIIDLVLVSLYCIFKQGYFLKECPYCKSIFITHDKRRKYCLNLNGDDKDCAKKLQLKRQSEREQSGSAHMHKNLRTMFAHKYGVDSEAYNEYMTESQKWRDEIREGNATEDEYAEWLKSQYAKKYKNK